MESPCPKCGYCPGCGRSRRPQPQWFPNYPWYYPSYPEVWCDTNTTTTSGYANVGVDLNIEDVR